MPTFIIYSKPGCHLCDRARQVLERCRDRAGIGFSIKEVDISRDAELTSRYGPEIPVITLDGREIGRHFLRVQQVLEILAAQPVTQPRKEGSP